MSTASPPESVEVTGVGIVNAAGAGATAKAYWECLSTRQPTWSTEHLFGPGESAQRVMRTDAELVDHGYSPRQIKRLDRLVVLASAAMSEALRDADLDLDPGQGEGDRVGIFVGNATGGWAYVEPQLYPLYRDPYVATAWVPTAGQGEVSITHGIGGCSRTFCAENLSSAFALRQACWALAEGTLDVAVVCGAEAPLTPLVYNACVRTGLVSPSGAVPPLQLRGRRRATG
jgi:3-oxoacyl-(acyl-carrier-protein) synthase